MFLAQANPPKHQPVHQSGATPDWLEARPADRGSYVFPSRVHNQPHPTARQYARIVHGWIESAWMDSRTYGTHSMRRTKAGQIYRKTGNLRLVQLLLGHAKIESTVRYLGIEVDDALTLSEQVEL
jgi:site-specific recombinase XerD